MFWESRLSTLRVNANSVNAARAEDEAEAERVECSELSSGRRWQNGGRRVSGWEEGSGIRGEGKGREQKGWTPYSRFRKIYDLSPHIV